MADWNELKSLATRLSTCPDGYTMHAETVRQVLADVMELIAAFEAQRERLDIVDIVHGPKAEQRWSALSAECARRGDALKRIQESLKRAGATVPAPDPMGTPESGILQGLSIALAVVEAEIPKPTVSPLLARLRGKPAEGGQSHG